MQAQPGPSLLEQLPISTVCMLADASAVDIPALKRLPTSQSIQVYLGHTAGTRIFPAELQAKQLAFCKQAAEQVPVYQLTFPHCREALPILKELLENIC